MHALELLTIALVNLYKCLENMSILSVGDLEEIFRVSSSQVGGTLYQLRNLLHRTAVHTDPHKDVNASEDFLNIIVTARHCCCYGIFWHAVTRRPSSIAQLSCRPEFGTKGRAEEENP